MAIVQAEKKAEPVVIASPVAVVSARMPEIRICSHSSIFYWWPVWVAGLVMAALTLLSGSRSAIVPSGSVYYEARHAIELPEGKEHVGIAGSVIGERAAESKTLGLIFTAILLLVVFVTNTPLRGLWSAIAVLLICLMTVTFAWLGAWPDILTALGQISIQMNLGFYLFFSSFLFLLWTMVVFGFDRMSYWKFRPGQLTLESVFGGGQKSYDTSGMLFEKLRDDPFRHRLLGLGSGDLVIKTAGAQREQIQIPNVLFLDGTLRRLQNMISERPE